MSIADGHGLPLALRTESASSAEVKLMSATLEERIVADVPERLIGDKAYDSDRLDLELLCNYGTEMIAPNKSNRRVPTRDGWPLRPLSSPLENRTALRLAVQLPLVGRSL